MNVGSGTETAARAARAAEYATGLVEGLRERMDRRFDRVEAKIGGTGFAIAAVEKGALDRGRRLEDALQEMAADVSTLARGLEAQERRLALIVEELRSMRVDLALAKSRALEDVRASRPDAALLEVHLEARRESIRARADRNEALLKWGGQIVAWATVGGGIALALAYC